jgi:LysM repeat protein
MSFYGKYNEQMAKKVGSPAISSAPKTSSKKEANWGPALKSIGGTMGGYAEQVKQLVPNQALPPIAPVVMGNVIVDTVKHNLDPKNSPSLNKGGGGGYAVKAGDSLSQIAAMELGDASRWPEIQALNGIANANAINVGQTLILPGSVGSGGPLAPTVDDAALAEQCHEDGPNAVPSDPSKLLDFSGDLLSAIKEVSKSKAYNQYTPILGTQNLNKSGNMTGMVKSTKLANVGKTAESVGQIVRILEMMPEFLEAKDRLDAVMFRTDIGPMEKTAMEMGIIISEGTDAGMIFVGLGDSWDDVKESMDAVMDLDNQDLGPIEKTFEFGKIITKGGSKIVLDAIPFLGGIADKIEI